MSGSHSVQLCPQVPPTSTVGHRDQQHYVCCENPLYCVTVLDARSSMDVSTNPVRLHRENTTVPYLSAVFESQVYGAGTVKSQLVVAAPINVTTHVNESRHCSSASVTEQVRRPPGRRPHTQPDGAARRRRRSFNCVIGDSGDSLYSARLGSLKVTATFIINQRLLLQE